MNFNFALIFHLDLNFALLDLISVLHFLTILACFVRWKLL